jgi:hypothetical protein
MSRAHEILMSEYYCARDAQEQRAEDYSAGYSAELQEFYDYVEPKLTFKEFLIGRKGNNGEC